jgi:hypothetical protein
LLQETLHLVPVVLRQIVRLHSDGNKLGHGHGLGAKESGDLGGSSIVGWSIGNTRNLIEDNGYAVVAGGMVCG